MSYNCRVTIDFDNTIVAYDDLFVATARERELLGQEFAGTKSAVRDAIRQRRDGELEWQTLQADVYGKLIDRAPPYAGVRDFILVARSLGAHVTVVSHKTVVAAARPTGANLREAAMTWLRANEFIGNGRLAVDDIYFESSRKEKLQRICRLQADIVIDDLIEILTDDDFPPGARRWLFLPGGTAGRCGAIERFTTWKAMIDELAA